MPLIVNEIIGFEQNSDLEIPLFESKIAAGFPTPTDDFVDRKIDLNRHIVQNPQDTYFVRVGGDSMINAGIYDGDILVVDRKVVVREGKIVIADLDGELTVKRLNRINGKLHLVAENPDYPPISISPECSFQVWGVVTYVIHQPK
ncbi:MAG: translesion error-prone DNA polymerase V autoproteolytic subunit [Candidatus Caenarcaniphilales bacterium]|nr:translesion error-prone DNA polymerase V autoproteolytic subunit [Candidatus Caenarcaniphilales bacterium]